jgi:hypothetical protein
MVLESTHDIKSGSDRVLQKSGPRDPYSIFNLQFMAPARKLLASWKREKIEHKNGG